LDAKHDHLAGIALRFVAFLRGTFRCQTRIDRKLDVGITRGIGLPEGIVTRQTCGDRNLLGTKIKIGEFLEFSTLPLCDAGTACCLAGEQ